MKKTVLLVSLCLMAGLSFAQKKAVKQAKSAIEKTAEARELIKPALTDAETANDPETWKVAGDIEFKSFDKEYDKEMTKGMSNGVGGDPEIMYTGLANIYDYYLKADELAQQPDEKGKVKNKVRKDIVKNFKQAYPFYVNAGVHYNDQKDFKKAADFFEKYWELPKLPLFEGEELVVKDSIFQTIKYYAVISAIQSKDKDRAINMLNKIIADEYIPTSAHSESDPYELLCDEYQKAGDSINFVKTLKMGAEKFPRNQYFTPNLINEYLRAGQSEKAIEYLDQAIKNDPESACELLSVKGSLFANDKKYDAGIEVYKSALNTDGNCERALEGLGVVYVLQAQDLKEKASQITNRQELVELDKSTVALYQESLPMFEKFLDLLRTRGADKDKDIRPALVKLQNVYYNLCLLNVDKNKELEEIENELGINN